jgi:hypothetical protein
VIVTLRKLHWDAVQHNLHGLAETIGGQVLRKGFLARPVYHGNHQNIDFIINFSSEKGEKGRLYFIDISLARKFKHPLTISSLQWIKDRGESDSEFEPLKIFDDRRYGIRKNTDSSVIKTSTKSQFDDYIQRLDPFNFIYCSTNGMLFEKECKNIANETKHPILKNILDSLFNLVNIIQ